MLGKLKQRPTMASFPPWAASEQGLPGRPLGAPVISCAGCGAPGQPQMGRKQAGHLLPARWAGPPRPESPPLAAGPAQCTRSAMLCASLPGRSLSCAGLARPPRRGNLTLSPPTSPSCTPTCSCHLHRGPVSATRAFAARVRDPTELRTRSGREQCIGY